MKKVSCLIIAIIVGILLYASTLGCQKAEPLPTEPHTPEPTFPFSQSYSRWATWIHYWAEEGKGVYIAYFYLPDDFPYAILSSKDVSREGYTFQYWNTEKDGSGIAYYPGDVIQTRSELDFHNLYAIWEKNTDELTK